MVNRKPKDSQPANQTYTHTQHNFKISMTLALFLLNSALGNKVLHHYNQLLHIDVYPCIPYIHFSILNLIIHTNIKYIQDFFLKMSGLYNEGFITS